MKIIDLLNKIANGEEVPKKVKYDGQEWEYNPINDYEGKKYGGCLLNQITLDHLTDEVEILEEKKKIPEKLDIRQEKNIKNNWKWKVYGKEHSYNISTPQKIIADKVNEICDYLKCKGE